MKKPRLREVKQLAESPHGEQVAESGFEPGLSEDPLPLVALAPSGQRMDEMLNPSS